MMFGREVTTSTDVELKEFHTQYELQERCSAAQSENGYDFHECKKQETCFPRRLSCLLACREWLRAHPPYYGGNLVWYFQRHHKSHRCRELQVYVRPLCCASVNWYPIITHEAIQFTGKDWSRSPKNFQAVPGKAGVAECTWGVRTFLSMSLGEAKRLQSFMWNKLLRVWSFFRTMVLIQELINKYKCRRTYTGQSLLLLEGI